MRQSVEASIQKATKLHKRGNSVEALDLLKDTKSLYPDNVRLGIRYDAIHAEVVRSVAGSEPPEEVIAHLKALHADKKFELLMRKCEILLEVQPDSSNVWNMLGAAQLEIKMAAEAEISFKKAITLSPEYVGALINYSKALNFLGKPSLAIPPLLKAILLSPEREDAYQSLASVYHAMNRDDEAEKFALKALEINANYTDAKNILGLVKLRQQKFTEGWRLAETRFDKDFWDVQFKPKLDKPEWNGEHVETLFAWAEQGVGDEAMFASCFEDLLKHCDNLIVSATERLIPLFSRSFASPRIRFVPRSYDSFDFEYDMQIPMMSALGRLRPDTASFENKGLGYLVSNPAQTEEIKSELRQIAGERPIFGISWFSLATNSSGKKRSVELRQLVKSLPKNAFVVSLQYGSTHSDIEKVEKELGLKVFSFEAIDNQDDLDGLCSLICACDHIVSIDNATVHFAGALGKRCDLLLPFSANWRWGLNGNKKTVWYDNVRMNWQSSEGQWRTSLKSLKAQLKA